MMVWIKTRRLAPSPARALRPRSTWDSSINDKYAFHDRDKKFYRDGGDWTSGKLAMPFGPGHDSYAFLFGRSLDAALGKSTVVLLSRRLIRRMAPFAAIPDERTQSDPGNER
jgi:hypothetical protein